VRRDQDRRATHVPHGRPDHALAGRVPARHSVRASLSPNPRPPS
jgi:hypothetical protein